jgi:hypothetical protein
MLLDLGIPFANFGALHPALSPTDDLSFVQRKLVQNFEQISQYTRVYCELSHHSWCSERQKYA